MTAVATVKTTESRDLIPDLVGVKSRVSWSAIFGGAITAMACYLVLTLLMGAVGVTLTEAGVRTNAIGIGILVALILTMVVSLFLGGWVSAQLTVGENRQEAVIYGLLTWALVTAAAMGFVGMGARAGYFAVVGSSVMVHNTEQVQPWENGLRSMGVSEAKITDLKASMDPNRLREVANDPANQERAREAAVAASWTALVATMLSMAAAIGGAIVGRGTTFRLFPRVVIRQETRSPLIIPSM